MNTRIGAAVLIFLLAASGCDSQAEQDAFADDAGLPPSGITSTDADGNILQGGNGEDLVDEDDWREAPRFRGPLRVDPAYPNPAGDEVVSIPVTIFFPDTVFGLFLSRRDETTGQLVTIEAKPEASQPGTYLFIINPTQFARVGLHRVYIFDRTGEIVSYGDILIQ